MFRTAAVVYLAFGLIWIWRFGFTDYDPGDRPLGVGLGVLAVVIGVFLLRTSKLAIGLSGAAAAIIAVSAAVAAPTLRGPVLLAFAGVAIVVGLYAALAARVMFETK